MSAPDTTALMKTMVRNVDDDFAALMMCNAMEEAGGRPFSVAVDSKTGRWCVFGQVVVGTYDAVDDAFHRLMGWTEEGE